MHVLLALNCIYNDDKEIKTIVNHIDQGRSNFAISNMEWCTPQENNEKGASEVKVGVYKYGTLIEQVPTITKCALLFCFGGIAFSSSSVGRTENTGCKLNGFAIKRMDTPFLK